VVVEPASRSLCLTVHSHTCVGIGASWGCCALADLAKVVFVGLGELMTATRPVVHRLRCAVEDVGRLAQSVDG